MRLQLALNVSDLDKAVDFYTRMFGVEPAKIRPGYANFAVADPPLKLVLFEGQGEPGSINHLGVETETAAITLLRHGCYRAQGFLLSRPVAGGAMESLLAKRRIPVHFSAAQRL